MTLAGPERTTIQWRRLSSSELDHETLWLSVSAAACVVGAVWIRFDLPVPPCSFHRFTGYPCPGCGATRAMREIAKGHFGQALHNNPAAVIALSLVLLYDVYAIAVLAARLPRLRIVRVSAPMRLTLRLGLLFVVLANWAWVIHAKM